MFAPRWLSAPRRPALGSMPRRRSRARDIFVAARATSPMAAYRDFLMAVDSYSDWQRRHARATTRDAAPLCAAIFPVRQSGWTAWAMPRPPGYRARATFGL